VGLDKEVTVEEGAEGLTYYDEQGNPLDVSENVDPVAPVVHYPAVAAAVPFETERVAVVGLKEPRIAVEGVEGVEYQDEDGNALGSDEDVAPINEVIEYPALEVLTPFETERRAVIDLDEERVVVEGKDGIHYEDEDGNIIESDDQSEPVTQIIEYPAVLSTLPFETEEVETDELEAGKRQVITKGEEGVAYFDEDGELFEVVTEPVNEVVLVGVAKSEQEQAPVQKPAPQPTQTEAKASVNRDEAIQTVTGLTNLSREERKQVIEAIESTDSQDKVDALVAAAQELDNVRDKEVEAKAGQRLPDTATASWALGLIGMTSVLSGLGIKKFKK
ncbi:MAG TPA: G5 domain-containing protein, partial [Alloiococcus sp.]|nr:G5 domain-containing protein [Alloiococcus sp.]